MRVNITGSAGAGKTTLAKVVAAHLGVPAYHLDAIVWQPGWRKTPTPLRAALEAQITRQPSWVIDGVSATVRDIADVVVVLDPPWHQCLRQALRRNLPYLFRSRPGLPERCPEILILPKLIRMILMHPTTLRPVLLQEAASSDKYFVVSDPKAHEPILEKISTAS